MAVFTHIVWRSNVPVKLSWAVAALLKHLKRITLLRFLRTILLLIYFMFIVPESIKFGENTEF